MSKAKRIKRSITKGRVYIRSSFNNTLITLTDMSGNVVAWSSSGNVGLRAREKILHMQRSWQLTKLSKMVWIWV